MGEWKHSLLQAILIGYFRELSRKLPIRVAAQMRMRVSATRFRIPDICIVLKSQPGEAVLTRMTRIIERVREYIEFGVHHVWMVDPASRAAYSYTREECREVRDCLATHGPDLPVCIADLFRELDEALKDEA